MKQQEFRLQPHDLWRLGACSFGRRQFFLLFGEHGATLSLAAIYAALDYGLDISWIIRAMEGELPRSAIDTFLGAYDDAEYEESVILKSAFRRVAAVDDDIERGTAHPGDAARAARDYACAMISARRDLAEKIFLAAEALLASAANPSPDSQEEEEKT
jgi:hypothetical protein